MTRREPRPRGERTGAAIGVARSVRTLGAIGIALAAGCLPRGAIGTRESLEADVYALRVSVEVVTTGDVALEPFTWTIEGRLLSSHARTFRDGSLGRLVRWEGMTGRVERPGAPPKDVPVALDGAWMEMRAFPSGKVLSVEPLAPWAGTGGHAEVLDAIWPALSPEIPALRVGESADHATSWPTWVRGGPRVHTRMAARWQLLDRQGPVGTWTYAGDFAGEGGYVRATGRAEGQVELDASAPRLLAHRFVWTRTVETTWAQGARVAQAQRLEGELRHAGTAPAPAPEMALHVDDPASEAQPLTLPDGAVLPRAAAAPPGALPFLFVPDDLPDSQAVGKELAAPGSMAPQEARP